MCTPSIILSFVLGFGFRAATKSNYIYAVARVTCDGCRCSTRRFITDGCHISFRLRDVSDLVFNYPFFLIRFNTACDHVFFLLWVLDMG